MTIGGWVWTAFLLWLVAHDFFDGPADWPDQEDEELDE